MYIHGTFIHKWAFTSFAYHDFRSWTFNSLSSIHQVPALHPALYLDVMNTRGRTVRRNPSSGTTKFTSWRRRDSIFFPQLVCPHWGVLTVTLKARCSIEVASSVSGQFPVNFHTEWLLWDVHVHFDRAGSRKTRHLIQNLAKGPLRGSLYRDLAKRPLMDILLRDLAKRSLTEILPSGLLHKSCQESFYRERVQRSHKEILPRYLL
jgi:hypothetical protein